MIIFSLNVTVAFGGDLLTRKNIISVMVFFGLSSLMFFFFFKNQNISKSKQKLNVLSYSTFSGMLGPGDQLKSEFEKFCNCEVKIINGGEAGVLLQKLRFLDEVDIVIGLDQFQLQQASEMFQWHNFEVSKYGIIEDFLINSSKKFLPFDWAPLTFIYRKGEFSKNDVIDWEEVIGSNKKLFLSLQNPRISGVGQHLLWWLWSRSGQNLETFGELLKKLKPKVHTISPGWDTAYGVFQKGHAEMTFSYVTSLLYHWVDQKDLNYKAVVDGLGHPYQVEYFGIPQKSQNLDLAQKFSDFLLTEAAQTIFMNKNYMKPVIKSLESSIKNDLPKLKRLENFDSFLQNQKSLTDLWQKIM